MCILQYITDKYLDFYDIMNLIKINKKCNRIKIKKFINIPSKIKNKLLDEILQKYKDLQYLYASFNLKITIKLKK